jgi:aerobic carbon-monoxide dehydrogenase small subunit
VRANVNGEWREADAWPGASLLTLLRDVFGLTGSKNACEQGECGSCSVWMDDELVCACLVLAAQAHDRHVRTVESVGDGQGMSAVQDAFVEAGAVQCGFCTPGFVVAVTDLLAQDPNPNEVQVREALSGNICRCTGYAKILDAVILAGSRLRERR